MRWSPFITVASIIEDDGKFLLVEESTEDGIRFNQPAGHLEPNETIIEAAARETLEETAYTFIPEYLIGIYYWYYAAKDTTYLRFAFGGKITGHDPDRKLDDGIIRASWVSESEIRACVDQHRNPLLLRCIEDYKSGKKFSLDLLHHYV
jgi:8-oxo-dGTP pyrophosphatase MutT (NUDIX family)